jgi:hypothetical protein
MSGGTLCWTLTKTCKNKREGTTKAATRSAIFETLKISLDDLDGEVSNLVGDRGRITLQELLRHIYINGAMATVLTYYSAEFMALQDWRIASESGSRPGDFRK